MKAKTASQVSALGDIPNIGPSMIRDFKLVGVTTPSSLSTEDGYELYQKLCAAKGIRQDPCVLDVCMAAVDFMNGASAKPWWGYTQERKRRYPNI